MSITIKTNSLVNLNYCSNIFNTFINTFNSSLLRLFFIASDQLIHVSRGACDNISHLRDESTDILYN